MPCGSTAERRYLSDYLKSITPDIYIVRQGSDSIILMPSSPPSLSYFAFAKILLSFGDPCVERARESRRAREAYVNRYDPTGYLSDNIEVSMFHF